MNTTIIALALAAAPTDKIAPFDVADAEVVTGESSTQLTAYDAEGEVAAELVVWADPTGRSHVDAVFADGLYLSAIITGDGQQVEFDSDNVAEVAARMNVIDSYLATSQPQEGWGWCAGSVAVFATGCITSSAPAIVSGAVGITCNCVPLFVEGMEC